MTHQIVTSERIHVNDLLGRLVEHPLYVAIRDEGTLRTFMRAHVFCVWDFQCLLKALQRSLTCVEVPWLPTASPDARRLVNEIVLDEESDEDGQGGYLSHFELYLEAMRECGADTAPIEGVLTELRAGQSAEKALARPALPRGVSAFVGHTLRIAGCERLHRMVASFALGREEVIPAMFQQFVRRLSADAPTRWARFLYYLNRHIEADGERHGPMALALLERLCADDARLWSEAEETARESLDARLALWDAILTELPVP